MFYFYVLIYIFTASQSNFTIYSTESSDLQPHHQVLQTVPAGEVSHHVRVSWSYAQRQVRILLNLST